LHISLDPAATTTLSTLSLRDALPIYRHPFQQPATAGTEPAGHVQQLPAHPHRGVHPQRPPATFGGGTRRPAGAPPGGHLPAAERSEEHTSELQSRENLVCRLLLEKKK